MIQGIVTTYSVVMLWFTSCEKLVHTIEFCGKISVIMLEGRGF